MKKGLLIDDLSLKGWKSILEKAVIKETAKLDYAINSIEAEEKLKEKFDIIFLDIRLTEEDHKNHKIKEFSGFKILKNIKHDFSNPNFSTPIILITGSNKIWNIEGFRNDGIDAYFIKEHPDYVYDPEFSRNNLNALQNNYSNLLELGANRNEIWELCNNILRRLETHPYFDSKDKHYLNVKKRIIDKIKMGYAYLFSKQTNWERKVLLANNESLSFIIFWSILEELSKGFTNYDETWERKKGFKRNEKNWRFRNRIFFIEKIDDNTVKINFQKDSSGNYVNQNITYNISDREYKTFTSPVINLSIQIRSVLAAYVNENNMYEQLSKQFKELNQYRNKIDYIHSRVSSIFQKELVNSKKTAETFKKNIEILSFIQDILKLKV